MVQGGELALAELPSSGKGNRGSKGGAGPFPELAEGGSPLPRRSSWGTLFGRDTRRADSLDTRPN